MPVRCIFDECNKYSSFNYENIKDAIYCDTHKLAGMTNVKSRKCLFIGCKIRPNFNYINEL